jgi:hypothetical protein
MTSVTYSSTRGGQKNLDFRSAVMTGLAHDRGLFVPDSMPTVSKEELEAWRSLSYPDLAVKVISKFVKDDQVPAEKLADIVKRSCAAFRHEDVTPVVDVGGHAVLVSCGDHRIDRSIDRYGLIWIDMENSSHFFSFVLEGTFPWTDLRLQRRCSSNAWKLL